MNSIWQCVVGSNNINNTNTITTNNNKSHIKNASFLI